jgi:release factor glutamine methyltransferase
MNSKQLFQDFVSGLTRADRGEAQAIGYVTLESLFGLSRTEILVGKDVSIIGHEGKISEIIARVNRDEPIQYILGEADFYGRKFLVTPSVLIPRPETEELVLQVIRFTSNKNYPLKILDIGAGSGCIPVTLSLEISNAQVFATDISEDALAVARTNSQKLNARVEFLNHNILTSSLPINGLDVITSNPPYIAETEKSSMSPHVVNHEPHLALFVSDRDPLIFYRAIADQAKYVLKPDGMLIVEINERFGNEVKDIFVQKELKNVSLLKDVSGKDRMVAGFLGFQN